MCMRSCASLASLESFFLAILLAVLRVLATTETVGSSWVGSLRMPRTTLTALSLEASPHIHLRILVLKLVREAALGMLHNVG